MSPKLIYISRLCFGFFRQINLIIVFFGFPGFLLQNRIKPKL